MNYEESIAYLESLTIYGINLSLTRIKKMLDLLGHPETAYRTVHVTGTNGKGSVCAMLDGILRCSGISTGFFSSPHLESYTERIRIDGKPIDAQDFADNMDAMKRVADAMVRAGMEHPTQFEMLTALAFYAFRQAGVSYAVIEVGLGGTYDSTNVITPEVSVITNVTMEHADRLGGTLEHIAENKAGIIKEGVPVVTAAEGLPLAVIRKRAEALAAAVFVFGEDFSARTVKAYARHQVIACSSELTGTRDALFKLSLLGSHQACNAALAIMTAHLLANIDDRITVDKIKAALPLVTWPGRFECMTVRGVDVLLDGAHNPAGIRALRAGLDEIFPEKKRLYLLGILKDKEIDVMLRALLRKEDAVVVTMPVSARADSAADLLRHVRRVTEHARAEGNYKAAFSAALSEVRTAENADERPLFIVCGSLYLIGAVRSLILEEADSGKAAEMLSAQGTGKRGKNKERPVQELGKDVP